MTLRSLYLNFDQLLTLTNFKITTELKKSYCLYHEVYLGRILRDLETISEGVNVQSRAKVRSREL